MKKISPRRDLLQFLKKPTFDRFQDLSIKAKIGILLKVLILTYIGLIVANLPFQVLKGLNVIGEISSNVNIAVETITKRNNDYKPYFILSSVILVPLLEETAFRLFLTKYRVDFFIMSISVIFGALIVHFINTTLWRPDSYLYIRIRLGFLYSIALHFIILTIRFGLPELINALKAKDALL